MTGREGAGGTRRDRLDVLYRTYANDMSRAGNAVTETAILGIAIHEALTSLTGQVEALPPHGTMADAIDRLDVLGLIATVSRK